MPELPEVEVLRRSLEPLLRGRTIRRVEVRERRLRERVPRGFEAAAAGRRIEGLRRRAKYLLIDLSGGATLVIHLGMSGRLTVVGEQVEREPHEHLAFYLSGRTRLRLRDPRRFGLALLVPTALLERDRHFAALGVEPLADEFSGELLARVAHRRRGPVKNFLMDQRIVVGVGNIYATEALHRCEIRPTRSVARLSRERFERLAAAVREVLEQAIGEGGTTLNDFTDGRGEAGYFQVELAVYGRPGEPCPRCGGTIRRIVQAGRSSFYCPDCQR